MNPEGSSYSNKIFNELESVVKQSLNMNEKLLSDISKNNESVIKLIQAMLDVIVDMRDIQNKKFDYLSERIEKLTMEETLKEENKMEENKVNEGDIYDVKMKIIKIDGSTVEYDIIDDKNSPSLLCGLAHITRVEPYRNNGASLQSISCEIKEQLNDLKLEMRKTQDMIIRFNSRFAI